MRISVIGLGYVGAVTAVCLARDGNEVVGVDVDEQKLALLKSGQAPIIEEGLQEVTQQAAASGRLHTQSDIDDKVARCELIFVCVGTPSAPNGSQDLTAVMRVAEQLGRVLATTDGFPVIVVRSTVYPGVTETVIKSKLEEFSGKVADRDFGLCFQPEFLREGSSVSDYYNPPFTIVGAASDRPVEAVRRLFGSLPAEFIETDIRTAEMMKLVCNAFHALKVSFANEVGRLGKQLGLDGRAVMEIVCKDRSLNISPAYLRPGFAYGGSCLPKDLRALLHLGKRNDVDVPLLQGIATSNDLHISRAATMVRDLGKRRVALVGLSFKPGTDDLRESPLVTLAEQLIGKGYDLRIYDPAVSLARLIGANRRYIENAIPHIGQLLREDLSEVLSHGETVVVGYADQEIRAAVRARHAAGAAIVDLAGLTPRGERLEACEGMCW